MKYIEIYIQDYSKWDHEHESKRVLISGKETDGVAYVSIARTGEKLTTVSIEDLKKAIKAVEMTVAS